MELFSHQPNYNEQFPHLDKAPIIESVIDLQVVSIAPWDHKALIEQLKQRLPGYGKIEEIHEFKHNFSINGPKPLSQDLGCVGLKVTSRDEFYIAQFSRARFSLSRVKKYENWSSFCDEVSRLWGLYKELVRPTAIKRIGVRFINRMLADYKSKDFLLFFNDAPRGKQICDWDLEHFLHRDVLQVPNTYYKINIIKTIASSPKTQDKVAAILDCDVSYSKNVSCEWDDIAAHLKIMHWVKNKAFFESIPKRKLKEYA